MQMRIFLSTLLHMQRKAPHSSLENPMNFKLKPSRLLCMKVDFICTLDKLLEEKHPHFNTYCWILKHVFLYIKKTFRKQNTNRVFAQKPFWLWGLSLWNWWMLRDRGTGGPRTSGPTSSLLFQSVNSETPAGARVSDGSNWCNGHQELGNMAAKAAAHIPALAFILVDSKSS